jgi:arylsulfatase A-like enzyme
VPLLIDVPASPSGAPGESPVVRDEFVEHVDLFPTLCELVGAPIPDLVQGRSLVPLLGDAPAPENWRDAVFSQIGDVWMIRTAAFKLNVYGGQPGELYDLRDDPQEFYNRIDDPAYAEAVASLFERLKAWEAANR